MSKFINLKTDPAETILVDAASIVAIEIYENQYSGFRITSKQGTIFDVDAKKWGIELQDVLKKMEDAGFPLVAIPGKHGDRSYDGYLSPAAVTTIDTSKTTDKGFVGANIGLDGAVYFETTGTKREDIDKLVTAARATGKNLLQFGANQLAGNWGGAGDVFIDPSSVRRIVQYRNELQVMFDNSPFFRAALPETKQADLIKEANALSKGGDKRDLFDIFAEAQKRHETENASTVATIAGAIAGNNSTLVRLPAPEQQVYVRPGDFVYVQEWKTDDGKFALGLQPPRPASGNFAEAVKVFFTTEEERKTAFGIFANGTPVAKTPAVSAAPKKHRKP